MGKFKNLRDLLTPKIRLSSDSASQRTPLPSAKSSRYRATSGLSPQRTCAHRAHKRYSSLLLRQRGVFLCKKQPSRILHRNDCFYTARAYFFSFSSALYQTRYDYFTDDVISFRVHQLHHYADDTTLTTF